MFFFRGKYIVSWIFWVLYRFGFSVFFIVLDFLVVLSPLNFQNFRAA